MPRLDISVPLHLTVALRCLEPDTILTGMATEPAIGTAIKRARERKRWTQRQLAQALGVNIKSVDNWESGRTSPRNSIGALEEVLGIDLSGEAPREPDVLQPTDQWEADVLADRYLPDEDKRWLIEQSRAARLAYVEARRARREQEQAAARSDRGRAAG